MSATCTTQNLVEGNHGGKEAGFAKHPWDGVELVSPRYLHGEYPPQDGRGRVHRR